MSNARLCVTQELSDNVVIGGSIPLVSATSASCSAVTSPCSAACTSGPKSSTSSTEPSSTEPASVCVTDAVEDQKKEKEALNKQRQKKLNANKRKNSKKNKRKNREILYANEDAMKEGKMLPEQNWYPLMFENTLVFFVIIKLLVKSEQYRIIV